MKKYQIAKNYSRRSVIKTLGAAAAAPFLPVLNAEAQQGVKKRLLVLTSPSGLSNGMIPSGAGSNYQNGPAFKVLDAYRSKINIYRGLDFAAYNENLSDGREFKVPNSHPALAPHLLTAAFTQRPGVPNDPGFNNQETVFHSDSLSIDQTVAQGLKAGGLETNLPYIFAGVRTPENAFYHQVYDRPFNSLYPQIDAPTLHRTVFSSAGGSGGGSDESIDAFIKQRQSVIDFAKEEIDAVSKVLSSEDKKKMDAHLTGVREAERRLGLIQSSGSLSCSAPDLQAVSGPDDEQFRLIGENMINTIVQGFACDVTRVATLMWGGAADNTKFTTKGINRFHHELTHGGIGGFASPASRDARDKITEWYAERFLYLLERLDSVQEGDGSTLLDNTLVLWTSEHSNETREHDRKNIPFITAGSCGGAINTGQFFDYTSDRRGHNDIYTTAAQAMGLSDITNFGIPDVSQGPLPGVLVNG